MKATNRVLVGCAVTVLATILAAGRSAFADGCFVWNKGADINEPSQKAIILYDEGREDLILQVKYAGPVTQFGWIVPVPGKPEVAKASMKCFYELSLLVQSANRYGKGRGLQDGQVRVHEYKTVGAYDVAVLEAGDAKSLSGWLQRNGFNWPDGRRDVLDHYVKKKWFFVAVKVNLPKAFADASVARKLHRGELHPLKFSFDSDECVYPLKISSVNSGPSEIDIYVLGRKQYVCGRMDFFSESEQFTRPFRTYSLAACAKELPRMKGKQWRLVKHTRVFRPEQMEDLAFAACDAAAWTRKKHAYVRDYFTKERETFFARLREYERHVGHGMLNHYSRPFSGHAFMGREYLSILPVAAPNVAVDLALELVRGDDVHLIEILLQKPPKAKLDALAEAIARRIGELSDQTDVEHYGRGYAYHVELCRSYGSLLLRLGEEARPGVDVLAGRLVKLDCAKVPSAFPLKASLWGQILRQCPHEAAAGKVVECLNDKTAWRWALGVFEQAAAPPGAVGRLSALLRSHKDNVRTSRSIMFALGNTGSREAIEPLMDAADKYPSETIREIGKIDANLAWKTANAWLDAEPWRRRAAGWQHFQGAKLSAERLQRALALAFEAAGKERHADVLYTIGAVLVSRIDPAGPDADRVEPTLQAIRDRVGKTRHNAIDDLTKLWADRMKAGKAARAEPAATQPAR